MNSLRIHLLGRLEVHLHGVLQPHFPTRAATSLFGYLVLNRGRLVSRDVLLGCFWAEDTEAVARKGLRNALWRVRATLETAGAAHLLETEGDAIGFARDGYWLDTAEFEATAERGAAGAAQSLEQLDGAVKLYRGDLLDGIYEDWCLFDRERLRLWYLAALERLMRGHALSGNWHEAVTYGRTLLHRDPLREQVHRDLMRYHCELGNRPAALMQYRECAAFLERELGIEPMAETQALRDEMLRGGRPAHAAALSEGNARAAADARRDARSGDRAAREVGDEGVLHRVLTDLAYAADRIEEARSALARDLLALDARARERDVQGDTAGT